MNNRTLALDFSDLQSVDNETTTFYEGTISINGKKFEAEHSGRECDSSVCGLIHDEADNYLWKIFKSWGIKEDDDEFMDAALDALFVCQPGFRYVFQLEDGDLVLKYEEDVENFKPDYVPNGNEFASMFNAPPGWNLKKKAKNARDLSRLLGHDSEGDTWQESKKFMNKARVIVERLLGESDFPNALCPRCKNSKDDSMVKTEDGKLACVTCGWEENEGEPATDLSKRQNFRVTKEKSWHGRNREQNERRGLKRVGESESQSVEAAAASLLGQTGIMSDPDDEAAGLMIAAVKSAGKAGETRAATTEDGGETVTCDLTLYTLPGNKRAVLCSWEGEDQSLGTSIYCDAKTASFLKRQGSSM